MGALSIRRLAREELPSGTEELARFLIGKTLVLDLDRGRISGRIVETEAYPPGDASGRAFTGESNANRSLYLNYGHAFVYLIYGIYYMLNVVSEPPGIGAAVLLRSLEPLEGIALMEEKRGTTRIFGLTRGPGRLAAALGIDRRYDGLDLCGDGPLWIGTPVKSVNAIGTTTRIGITKEVHQLLRFFEEDNPFVSGPAHARRHPGPAKNQ